MTSSPTSPNAATGGGAPALPPSFRFADLCAGIGGMRIPFEARGGICVVTAETDKHCLATYRANFKNDPAHTYAGDLRKVDPAALPDFDLLLAGFPCQSFSKTGISKLRSLGIPEGFAEPENGPLFGILAKIIAVKKPAVFLLENVRNLSRHDGGRSFALILETLEHNLGYETYSRVIDAAAWVPQHRERIFIVGFRDTRDFDFGELQIPAPPHPILQSILEPDPDPRHTLTKAQWDACKKRADDLVEKHGTGADKSGFGHLLLDYVDVSCTLTANYLGCNRPLILAKPYPRRLTPREAARLMGFDAPQGASWKMPVSDRQAYRQLGNAVVPPVVSAIADLLLCAPASMQPRLPFRGKSND